jgi:hypothetical protein
MRAAASVTVVFAVTHSMPLCMRSRQRMVVSLDDVPQRQHFQCTVSCTVHVEPSLNSSTDSKRKLPAPKIIMKKDAVAPVSICLCHWTRKGTPGPFVCFSPRWMDSAADLVFRQFPQPQFQAPPAARAHLSLERASGTIPSARELADATGG